MNRALSVADEWTEKVNEMNNEVMQLRTKCLQNLINGTNDDQSQSFNNRYDFLPI